MDKGKKSTTIAKQLFDEGKSLLAKKNTSEAEKKFVKSLEKKNPNSGIELLRLNLNDLKEEDNNRQWQSIADLLVKTINLINKGTAKFIFNEFEDILNKVRKDYGQHFFTKELSAEMEPIVLAYWYSMARIWEIKGGKKKKYFEHALLAYSYIMAVDSSFFENEIKEKIKTLSANMENIETEEKYITFYLSASLLYETHDVALAAPLLKSVWNSKFVNQNTPLLELPGTDLLVTNAYKIFKTFLRDSTVNFQEDDAANIQPMSFDKERFKEVFSWLLTIPNKKDISNYQSYLIILNDIAKKDNDQSLMDNIKKVEHTASQALYEINKKKCYELVTKISETKDTQTLEEYLAEFNQSIGSLKEIAEGGHEKAIRLLQAFAYAGVDYEKAKHSEFFKSEDIRNNKDKEKFVVINLHPRIRVACDAAQREVLGKEGINKDKVNLSFGPQGFEYPKGYLEKDIHYRFVTRIYEAAYKDQQVGMAYELGRLYYEGNVVNKNLFIARELFSHALEESTGMAADSRANYFYARLCFYGEGGRVDLDQAYKYLKIFEEGNISAEKITDIFYLLGEWYYFTWLLKQENAALIKSREFFLKAVEKKHIPSLYSLFLLAEKNDDTAKQILIGMHEQTEEQKKVFSELEYIISPVKVTVVTQQQIAQLERLFQKTDFSRSHLSEICILAKNRNPTAIMLLARYILNLPNQLELLDFLLSYNFSTSDQQVHNLLDWIKKINDLLCFYKRRPLSELEDKISKIYTTLQDKLKSLKLNQFESSEVNRAKMQLSFAFKAIQDETAILLRNNFPDEKDQQLKATELLVFHYKKNNGNWSLLTSLTYELQRHDLSDIEIKKFLILLHHVDPKLLAEITLIFIEKFKQMIRKDLEWANDKSIENLMELFDGVKDNDNYGQLKNAMIIGLQSLLENREQETSNYYGENLSDDSDDEDESKRQASDKLLGASKNTTRQSYKKPEEVALKILNAIENKKISTEAEYKSLREKIHNELGNCSSALPTAVKSSRVRDDLAILNHYSAQGKISDALQIITTKFCVAQTRGLHFSTSLWGAEQRRRFRREASDKDRPFHHKPLFSYAVYKHAQVEDFSDLSTYTQYKLEKSARLIQYNLRQLEGLSQLENEELPDWLKKSSITIRKFSSRATQLQQLYSNNYEKYHQFLKWQVQKENCCFISTVANPYVSMCSIESSDAAQYAHGNKFYEGQDFTRLRPQWNSELRAQHPHSGFIYASVHPLDDYVSDSHYVPADNMLAKLSISWRIVGERETSFNSWIKGGRVEYIMDARFPSFHHQEHPKIFEYKYGISKILYDVFRNLLGKESPHSFKRRLYVFLLGEYLSIWKTVRIIEIIDKERIKMDGGVLLFRTAQGDFSLLPSKDISATPNGEAPEYAQRRLFSYQLHLKRGDEAGGSKRFGSLLEGEPEPKKTRLLSTHEESSGDELEANNSQCSSDEETMQTTGIYKRAR